MQDYQTKPDGYFAAARRDIEPLLPAHCPRVLELGCGAGATLAWLKAEGRAEYTVGVEIFPAAAEKARAIVDEVICGDIEQHAAPDDAARFDLILCLDVLEHLVDPWATIDRLVCQFLAVGGTVIISVPNVRHHSVLVPLALGGRWDYANEGPLDRTHLRFFTHASALQLLHHPMLDAPRCLRPGFSPGSTKHLLKGLTLGLLREFLAFHYLISATKVRSA